MQAAPYDDAKLSAAIAVQSFGNFQNFNPRLHVLTTDGCFYNDTAFMVCPLPDTNELEKQSRYEVFIIYDQSSAPNADDPASLMTPRRTYAIFLRMLRRTGYLIDAVYPIDLSRLSSTCWVVLSRRSLHSEVGLVAA